MTAIASDGCGHQFNCSDENICPVCLEDIAVSERATIKPCEHVFCVKCLQIVATNDHSSNDSCPLCRGTFNAVEIIKCEIHRTTVQYRRTSYPWIFSDQHAPHTSDTAREEDTNEVLLNQSSERSHSTTLSRRVRHNRRSVYTTLSSIINITSRRAIAFWREIKLINQIIIFTRRMHENRQWRRHFPPSQQVRVNGSHICRCWPLSLLHSVIALWLYFA